eukprot:Ihof_evm3s473 gene=Ihof_evmTU3s473
MSFLKCISEAKGHADRVWCAAWHPNGKLLATCGGDKTVKLWAQEKTYSNNNNDTNNTKGTKDSMNNGNEVWVCVRTLDGAHTRTIRSVAWSPCGKYIATASFDNTTCIWERIGDGDYDLMATLEGHESEVKCATWSKSGTLLATCSRDKSVWVWEVEQDDEFECLSVVHGHTQDVKMCKFHPTQNVLVSCSYDDTIKLYAEEDDDWVDLCTLTGHKSTVWAIDFDKTGDKMVSVSDDTSIKIWQAVYPGNPDGIEVPGGLFTYTCQATLNLHSRSIYTVAWCPLTGLIATGGGDDYIYVLEE